MLRATAAFWAGFEKRAYDDRIVTGTEASGYPDAPQMGGNALQTGVGVGAATTGALAAHHVGRAMAQEAKERKLVPGSKRWKDFVKQIKPGDVLFSRSTKRKILPDVKDMLQGGMGSPHYHASMYTGNGRVFEHPGEGFTASYNSAKDQLGRLEDVVAYRPDVAQAVKDKALKDVPKEFSRAKYKTKPQVLMQGAKNLLLPGGGGKACTKGPDGRIVCTSVIQRAYQDLFHDTTNIEEMRRNPKMKLVARLERGKPALREKVLYRGAYPILKNLKWGLGAGALAYAGKKVHEGLKKDEGVEAPVSAQA